MHMLANIIPRALPKHTKSGDNLQNVGAWRQHSIFHHDNSGRLWIATIDLLNRMQHVRALLKHIYPEYNMLQWLIYEATSAWTVIYLYLLQMAICVTSISEFVITVQEYWHRKALIIQWSKVIFSYIPCIYLWLYKSYLYTVY